MSLTFMRHRLKRGREKSYWCLIYLNIFRLGPKDDAFIIKLWVLHEAWIQRVVKGIFVTRDRPFFFPVKCEMGYFFLVNRDFHTSREAWFCKIIIRETRNKCLIRREPWFSWWLSYRELWKDRFIFHETWSRPPLYHPKFSNYRQIPVQV